MWANGVLPLAEIRTIPCLGHDALLKTAHPTDAFLFHFFSYNGNLPGGDRGRWRSKLSFHRREKPNGLKPGQTERVTNPEMSEVRRLLLSSVHRFYKCREMRRPWLEIRWLINSSSTFSYGRSKIYLSYTIKQPILFWRTIWSWTNVVTLQSVSKVIAKFKFLARGPTRQSVSMSC